VDRTVRRCDDVDVVDDDDNLYVTLQCRQTPERTARRDGSGGKRRSGAVDSPGNLWIPPAIYMSSCAIDITNFPFDEQTCNMKFGSWTYDGLKLDIHFYAEKAEIDISDYIDSNEWNLIGHPARRRVQYYVGLETPYIQYYLGSWYSALTPVLRGAQLFLGLETPYPILLGGIIRCTQSYLRGA